MGAITVHIDIKEGMQKLNQKSEDLPNVITLGIRRVALYFRDNCVLMAQSGHPEHPNVITGRLSGSMRYEMLSEGIGASAQVGSDVDYAPYVELGHMSPNWGDPRKGWHLVPAYPWFQPAIVQTFDSGDAERIFHNTVKQLIER